MEKRFSIGWAWLDALQPGDVVRFRSGALRTVIGVSHRGTVLVSARFPIKHCSWTRRGYTVLTRSDLKCRAASKTRARVNLDAYPVARKLQAEVACRNKRRVPGARCCDVVGAFE